MAETAETIEASGRRIGHHAWAEMRLFETLGAWSATMVDPRARVLVAGQSQHHAWHAELWHGLLPALPHLPAADLVAPADGDPDVVAALAALDDDPAADDAARLTAVFHTALPRLRAAYDDHMARTTPVTDGPIIRTLRLAIADVADDTQAGLDLLAALSA